MNTTLARSHPLTAYIYRRPIRQQRWPDASTDPIARLENTYRAPGLLQSKRGGQTCIARTDNAEIYFDRFRRLGVRFGRKGRKLETYAAWCQRTGNQEPPSIYTSGHFVVLRLLGPTWRQRGRPLSSPTLRREQNGKQTVDWVGFMGDIFEKMAQADAPAVNYSKTPADPKPARDLAAYAGHYGNSYYGPLVISKKRNGLSMTMGPQTMPDDLRPNAFRRRHVQLRDRRR
jgi:hypothetical protein